MKTNITLIATAFILSFLQITAANAGPNRWDYFHIIKNKDIIAVGGKNIRSITLVDQPVLDRPYHHPRHSDLIRRNVYDVRTDICTIRATVTVMIKKSVINSFPPRVVKKRVATVDSDFSECVTGHPRPYQLLDQKQ